MQHPGQRRPSNERRGPAWAALGVVLGVLLAGLVAIPGCLNPRPEEDPSALELDEPQGDTDVSGNDDLAAPADPARESCEDNALLSGCEPASPPAPGSAESPPPPNEEGSPADAPDAGGSSVYDAGAADAGAPAPASSPLAD